MSRLLSRGGATLAAATLALLPAAASAGAATTGIPAPVADVAYTRIGAVTDGVRIDVLANDDLAGQARADVTVSVIATNPRLAAKVTADNQLEVTLADPSADNSVTPGGWFTTSVEDGLYPRVTYRVCGEVGCADTSVRLPVFPDPAAPAPGELTSIIVEAGTTRPLENLTGSPSVLFDYSCEPADSATRTTVPKPGTCPAALTLTGLSAAAPAVLNADGTFTVNADAEPWTDFTLTWTVTDRWGTTSGDTTVTVSPSSVPQPASNDSAGQVFLPQDQGHELAPFSAKAAGNMTFGTLPGGWPGAGEATTTQVSAADPDAFGPAGGYRTSAATVHGTVRVDGNGGLRYTLTDAPSAMSPGLPAAMTGGPVSPDPRIDDLPQDVFYVRVCVDATGECATARTTLVLMPRPVFAPRPDEVWVGAGDRLDYAVLANDTLGPLGTVHAPVIARPTGLDPSVGIVMAPGQSGVGEDMLDRAETPAGASSDWFPTKAGVGYSSVASITGTVPGVYPAALEVCDTLFLYTSNPACGSAQLTVHVVGAPAAVEDAVTADPGAAVEVPVLGNDAFADALNPNSPAKVTIVDAPSQGAATVTADRKVSYAAAAGARGTDTLTYQVCDLGGCSSAPVRVSLTAATPTPVPTTPEPTTPAPTTPAPTTPVPDPTTTTPAPAPTTPVPTTPAPTTPAPTTPAPTTPPVTVPVVTPPGTVPATVPTTPSTTAKPPVTPSVTVPAAPTGTPRVPTMPQVTPAPSRGSLPKTGGDLAGIVLAAGAVLSGAAAVAAASVRWRRKD